MFHVHFPMIPPQKRKRVGIQISHQHLRREICDYLIAMEEIFAPHFDSRWPTYAAYVQNMRQDGSWGDDLTLTAAAHLLLKPIRIVSDLDIEEFRELHPPSSISPECWGPCITLAYLQFSHYEATEQVERNMKVKEVAPRSFKPSKKKTEPEARVRRVKFEFHICGQ